MRERASEMCSGQRAPRLQCTTKFDPVTRLARHASEPVTRLARHASEPVTKLARHASEPVTKLARNSKRPNQQAVMERVCDEKSGERRGDNLKITTQAVACFRKIFRESKFLHRRNVTKPGQTS